MSKVFDCFGIFNNLVKLTVVVLKKLLYIILLFLWSPTIFATHLVGGEMTYTCLGYNDVAGTYTYAIDLVVYRDCGPNNELGTFFDDLASIGIFHSDGSLYDELFIPYPGFNTNIDTEINNPCLDNPSDACVQKAVYSAEVELDFSNGAFDITYQRCCRNGSISNIVNGQSSGTTLTIHIPVPIALQCNSSPVFNVLPPAFLCVDSDMSLDFSANDPDGDQLIYSLCTPLLGASQAEPAPSPPYPPPYFPITWESGYDESTPFPGDPAIEIDPLTGIVTGHPTQVGIFTIGICVSEYKNGNLLSTVSRDYQIFVYDCPSSTVSWFESQLPYQFCDGLEVTFTNLSLNADNYFWDFGVFQSEADTSNEFEPTFLFPGAGNYNVMLIANAGEICADTSYQLFRVQPPVTIDFEIEGPNCINGKTYTFTPIGTIDGGLFTWDFGQGTQSTQNFPADVEYTGSGIFDIDLNYDINGCIGTVVHQIDVIADVAAIIEPQPAFCVGLELNLVNGSEDALYQWIISKDDIQILSNEYAPTIIVPEAGNYAIMLITDVEGACPDTAYEFYSAYPLMFPEFELDEDVFCFDDHSIDLEAGGVFQNIATFLWKFGENANQTESTVQNPQNIQFSEPGAFPVSLTISENNCVKEYIDIIEIHPNPLALFNISDTSGCSPLNVQFINLSEAWTPLEYTWEFGNGESASDPNPLNNFIGSGSFFVSLTVNTTEGCIDQNTYQFPIPIDVFPLPIANFKVEPSVVQIEYPHVYFTDLSQGATSILYIINDDDLIDDDSFNYTFNEAGEYQITQFVENEFACTAEFDAEVLVRGYLFYMPNAFTPNNDGHNDVIKPVLKGIETYQIKIFDRWGKIVFSSDDPYEGWDGNGVSEGVYNYVATLTDITDSPYQFSGSILLIR